MIAKEGMRTFRGDIIFVIAIMILLIIGLMAIFSASHSVGQNTEISNFSKQLYFIMIGIISATVITMIPTRYIYFSAYWVYGITILLLISSLIFNHGHLIKRWIDVGGIRFQPAELAKIGTLLALARFLADKKEKAGKPKELLISFAIVGLPFALIYLQPDLGTSLVFLAMILPMLYWAGISSFVLFLIVAPLLIIPASFDFYAFFAVMVLIAIISLYFKRGLLVSVFLFLGSAMIGVITPFLWNRLHEYQKHRILTFLGVETDPFGISYQVIQSKVAIGSGGFLGKGLLNGTQTQLRFLPAQHTDFIFSVIGEELGFVGGSLLLVLFLYMLLRCIYVGGVVRSRFLSLVSIGVASILAFHVLVNVGMTVGIFPVTGLPLPFISYGGSFMIVSFLLIGLVIHSSRARYQYLG